MDFVDEDKSAALSQQQRSKKDFSVYTKQDVEMNNELVAHGYSNFLVGILGCGLQNYLAYTQSVVYDRSGGQGKRSGIAVAAVTAGLFVIGPTVVVPHIPRSMAGALLLHVGLVCLMRR